MTTRGLTHTLTLTPHTHSHTHTLSLSHIHTHTHSPHTHTHTHTHSHTHTCTCTLTTHSHTHNHTITAHKIVVILNWSLLKIVLIFNKYLIIIKSQLLISIIRIFVIYMKMCTFNVKVTHTHTCKSCMCAKGYTRVKKLHAYDTIIHVM